MTVVAIDNPTWRLRGGFTPPLPPGSPETGDPLWTQGVLNGGKLGAHLAFSSELRLEDYIDETRQPPSAVVRPHPGFNWGMLANDQYGDCVIAMMLHAIEEWHLDANTPPPPFTDEDAIRIYSEITGFNPNDPNSDQGTNENDAMAYWKDHGLDVEGNHKIVAAVAVDPGNLQSCRRAIYEFGGLMIAVALPATAQGQTEWTLVGDPNHDPNSAPGSWGGHGVPYREYDPETFKTVTWAHELLVTVPFHEAYVEQAFVAVSEEMLNKTETGPSGVAWGDLVSDINKLSSASSKTKQSKSKQDNSEPEKASEEEDSDNKEETS